MASALAEIADATTTMLKGEHPPIEVLITRGEEEQQVESRHICHAVICNSASEIIASFGEKEFITFPRSSLKMIQAVAFGESDASMRFALDQECSAIACGSHSGEKKHVEKVRQWLAKIGLSESDLACGTHSPLDKASAKMLVANGEKNQPSHHMCSGKHCSMLSLARAQNWEVEGYCEYDHPVQQRVTEVCSHFLKYDLQQAPRGRDGCSIPAFALPLYVLARGLARFGEPSLMSGPIGEKRQQVAKELFQAMVKQPFFVAGSKQADTLMMQQANGAFVVKSGAEGVYTAALAKLKLGIAVKCVDGATRAAKAAMAKLLQSLELLPSEPSVEQSAKPSIDFADKPLTNFRGFRVGTIETRIS